MTVESSLRVRCGSCGYMFTLSARNVRAARQRSQEPVCRDCRRTRRKPSPRQQAQLRRWWLKRYSTEELFELGRGLGWC